MGEQSSKPRRPTAHPTLILTPTHPNDQREAVQPLVAGHPAVAATRQQTSRLPAPQQPWRQRGRQVAGQQVQAQVHWCIALQVALGHQLLQRMPRQLGLHGSQEVEDLG